MPAPKPAARTASCLPARSPSSGGSRSSATSLTMRDVGVHRLRRRLGVARARIASAIARCPASEARGRSGWESDSIRVSLISSPISSISRASSRECAAAVTAPWNRSSPSTPRPPASMSASIASRASSMRAQVLVRTTGRGQRGDLGLEGVAGVDDLGQPVGVRADRLDDAAGARLGDHRAVAVAHGDHADHLERDQGLAQGRPADAEPGGELALGRDPVARLRGRCRRSRW